MRDNDRLWDYFILIGVCLISVTLCYAVLDTAYGHVPYKPRVSTYTQPDIPQCNKELWLRIKDGCP